MKKTTWFVMALLVLSMLFGCVACQPKEEESQTAEESQVNEAFELTVREFNKYGNVILEVSFDDLKEKNIEPADIITVGIGDTSYDIPVGTEYSDVDSGNMICRFDLKDSKVILAINGGNFAETVGMAVKEKITEDPGYKWNVNLNTVSITLKEKNGYHEEYVLRHLESSTARTDYSGLTDAEFANCRGFLTSKTNLLYRGTTPLDESYGRNTYAMDFLAENGIKTIINLTESQEEMEAHATYADSYYSTCAILNDVMDYQFTSADFASKVAIAIRFMLENDGPYYIHCKEGKDRTGMFCAILECYLGATYEEIKDDYMKTYLNFYGVEEASEVYQIILNTNFNKTLSAVLGVEDLTTDDLQRAAKAYYLEAGLTIDELNALSEKFQ